MHVPPDLQDDDLQAVSRDAGAVAPYGMTHVATLDAGCLNPQKLHDNGVLASHATRSDVLW